MDYHFYTPGRCHCKHFDVNWCANFNSQWIARYWDPEVRILIKTQIDWIIAAPWYMVWRPAGEIVMQMTGNCLITLNVAFHFHCPVIALYYKRVVRIVDSVYKFVSINDLFAWNLIKEIMWSVLYEQLTFSSLETPEQLTNSADPDQSPQNAATDQCLHYLH